MSITEAGTPGLSLHDAIAAVRARIAQAALDAGREPNSVRLLLATKQQDAARIRAVVDELAAQSGPNAGPVLIGENRVQELVAKEPELAALVGAGLLEVHLVGHLQRNKINHVIGAARCVQTVDSLALAQALDARVRPGESLDVLIQVNVSGEESKSGVPAGLGAVELAKAVGALPQLHLRGFMTIGAPLHYDDDGAATADSIARVHAGYAQLRALRDEALAAGSAGTDNARELSMGMSHDFEHAIAEGATIVRVGQAIFGPRVV